MRTNNYLSPVLTAKRLYDVAKKPLSGLILALFLLPAITFAQGVAINTDDSEADPSAMLEIKSNSKGLLIPRMTQTEIENITNPAGGLMVYSTTNEKFYTFVSSEVTWKEIAYGTGTIIPFGDGSIGTGGSCGNTVAYGDYKTGQALGATEFVTIEVNVTAIGAYSITTNTANGYSFSANGVYSSTGTQTLDLAGSGTPVAYQTDNFTATASNSGGSCTFEVFINVGCGGTLTDSRDAQNYNTVQIGSQCWMAQNLNIGTMINGSNNQTDNSTIEKYCYSDNSSSCDTYGGLYQWDEMMEYTTSEGTRGICPTGWHLPTDDEWCTLENEVDAGTVDCNATGWRGTDAGGNLKKTGITHWFTPNTGATNSSGFTALASGYRAGDGSFSWLGYNGYFWSSTENGANALRHSLGYGSAQVVRIDDAKTSGFNVRCLQDEANINQAPAQPNNPTPVDASTGQSVSSILSWACSDPDGDPLTYDVYFGETNPPALVSSGQSATTYDPGLLTKSITYYWKITAQDNHSQSTEGPVWSFTVIGTSTMVVEVVNPTTGRTWMDRNLGASQAATSSTDAAAYGDYYQWGRINEGHENTSSGTTTTHATTALPNLGNSWDGLFILGSDDWLTTPDNILWHGENGTNNPCPTGFRLPTVDEWIAEKNSWSSNNSAGAYNSSLKLTVGGARVWTDGSVNWDGANGVYWSSTISNSKPMDLSFGAGSASNGQNDKANGFSVRCIKGLAVNQAPSQPTSPSPADASTDQAVNSTLSWTCSDLDGDPLTYDVYFGETNPPALVSSGQSATTYDPGTLNNSTTYYWKITAFDNYTNSTEGSVWSFATGTFGEVYNPATSEIWMDRNLGAAQVATSSTDAAAYGDLYQWGRLVDGHEDRSSGITYTLSSTDIPGHSNMIVVNSSPVDWRNPQNGSLWQGESGTSNPCPTGFRLPAEAEWNAERLSWATNDAAGAFASPLKLTVAGWRHHSNGVLSNVGSHARYWSSTINGIGSDALGFNSGDAFVSSGIHAYGFTVRCIKE